MEIQDLKNLGAQVRRDIIRQVHSSQSGHPSGLLGCTDMLVALNFNEMKINENQSVSGSLSQVLSVTAGAAYAKKLRKDDGLGFEYSKHS